MYHTVKTFVGEASGFSSHPVREAVQHATGLADQFFDDMEGDENNVITVLSTNTHIIEHGDYFSYIITITLNVEVREEGAEEDAPD